MCYPSSLASQRSAFHLRKLTNTGPFISLVITSFFDLVFQENPKKKIVYINMSRYHMYECDQITRV